MPKPLKANPPNKVEHDYMIVYEKIFETHDTMDEALVRFTQQVAEILELGYKLVGAPYTQEIDGDVYMYQCLLRTTFKTIGEP